MLALTIGNRTIWGKNCDMYIDTQCVLL